MGLRGLKFYTVKEVSVIMQVRIETVLRWIYARKLKASKLPSSRIWRIREEDIIEFMEQGLNVNDDSLEVASIEDEIEEQEKVVIVTTPKSIEKTKPKAKKVKRTVPPSKKNDMTFDFSSSKYGSKSSSIEITEEISQELIEENINEKVKYKSKASINNLNNTGAMLFCDIDEKELREDNIENIEIL